MKRDALARRPRAAVGSRRWREQQLPIRRLVERPPPIFALTERSSVHDLPDHAQVGQTC
jgi:hypothetical protein